MVLGQPVFTAEHLATIVATEWESFGFPSAKVAHHGPVLSAERRLFTYLNKFVQEQQKAVLGSFKKHAIAYLSCLASFRPIRDLEERAES